MGLVRTVGLVLHPRRDPASAIGAIMSWAAARDVTVLGLADEIGRIDCAAVPVGPDELTARAGLVVSLGGDGTMLRSMRLLAGRPTPVLGVNLGRLGFLAEVDIDELPDALTYIDEHRYTVEPRLAVRSVLPDGRPVLAFNDIVLVREPGHGSAVVAGSVERAGQGTPGPPGAGWVKFTGYPPRVAVEWIRGRLR